MNPTVLSSLAEEHIRDLHTAADQWRLAAAARPRKNRPAKRSGWAAQVWRRLARPADAAPLGYCTSC